MKKVFFAAALLLSSMMANAQMDSTNVESKESNEFKADPGKFIMEIGFSPLSSTYNDVNLMGGQLRGVYVLSERIELKLGLGFGINKENEDNGQSGDAWEATSTRTSNFSINPGFSYTFEGTKKLEPYVGAELGFGLTASKQVNETNGYKQTNKNKIQGLNTFEFLALTGFNYFFAKNIFIGVEVGLGVGANFDKGSYTETVENGKTTKVEDESDTAELEFSPKVVPTMRLGWAF